MLWPFLHISVPLSLAINNHTAFENLRQIRKREGNPTAGEMNRDQPGGDDVHEVVEEVSVGDAVDGGVDGEKEEEEVGDVADAA
jgi:hypothetical protein